MLKYIIYLARSKYKLAKMPTMLRYIFGDFMSTLILSAGLAALMSTMDSQLLTLSSIFTRDVYPLLSRQRDLSSVPGKIFVVALAMLGLFFAVKPSSTILQIATQTFTGLAVLFPTVLFGLYSKKPNSTAAITSIILGELLVILSYFGYVPTGNFLPAVPIVAVTFIVYIIVLLSPSAGRLTGIIMPGRRTLVFTLLFAILFALAVDWWQWPASKGTFGGFPLWMFYFIGLSAMQTLLMKWWLSPRHSGAITGEATVQLFSTG